jgi:hypothetical protein
MQAMKRTWVLAAMVMTLSPLTASAQEYVIKVKRPGLGDKSQVKSTGNSEVEFKLLDSNGNAVMDKKETKALKFIFHEIGLERAAAGEELVHIKRNYEHAERKVDGTRHTLPYQGKTLHIQKKNGNWIFEIEGEGDDVIYGKEAEELTEEFVKGGASKLVNDAFLPRKAVKVNDTWKLDVAQLAKDFSKDGKLETDDAKAKGSGKLLKVYQKNGKQFGVLELTIEVPVTGLINDGNKTPTKEGKITIKVERDGCIDGTLEESTIKVHFDGDIKGDIQANGMDLSLVISVHATAEELRVPVTK